MEAVFLVARAGTVSILADGLVAAIRCFMLVRAIVARMTAGAVRLECCILPGDNFGVGQMTIRALKISTMI